MGRTKADEKATNRFQMIAPLLNEELDQQERGRLLKQVASHHGLSERTIRRYLSQFKTEGFEGLKQKQYRSIPVESQDLVLEQAILLRREVPSRSIASIIQILEWDGVVEKGTLRRSTLQERLAKRGYSARQMKLYHETSGAVRRFQKRSRNALWRILTSNTDRTCRSDQTARRDRSRWWPSSMMRHGSHCTSRSMRCLTHGVLKMRFANLSESMVCQRVCTLTTANNIARNGWQGPVPN